MGKDLQQLFKFEEQEVRTVVKDGEGWFVAKDVCDILGLENVSLAVNGRKRKNKNGEEYISGGLDEDEKGIVTVNTLGGNQKVSAVNESGLYSLIFTSHKPQAKQFRKWVTSEVLPAIRRDGGYISSNITDEQADKLDKKLLLSTPQRRRKALEEATIDGKENVFTVYEDIKKYIKNQTADKKVKRLRHVEQVLEDKKKSYGTDIAFVVKIEELLVTVAKDIDKIRNHSYGARLREMNKQHRELQQEYLAVKKPALDEYYVIPMHPLSENSMYESVNSFDGKAFTKKTKIFENWIDKFKRNTFNLPTKKELDVDVTKEMKIYLAYDHLDKFDSNNFKKSIIDVIAKHYRFDDKLIKERHTVSNKIVGSYDEGKIYFLLTNLD